MIPQDENGIREFLRGNLILQVIEEATLISNF